VLVFYKAAIVIIISVNINCSRHDMADKMLQKCFLFFGFPTVPISVLISKGYEHIEPSANNNSSMWVDPTSVRIYDVPHLELSTLTIASSMIFF
jgi:hypothetical protein